jgi:hypothetical protein
VSVSGIFIILRIDAIPTGKGSLLRMSSYFAKLRAFLRELCVSALAFAFLSVILEGDLLLR